MEFNLKILNLDVYDVRELSHNLGYAAIHLRNQKTVTIHQRRVSASLYGLSESLDTVLLAVVRASKSPKRRRPGAWIPVRPIA